MPEDNSAPSNSEAPQKDEADRYEELLEAHMGDVEEEPADPDDEGGIVEFDVDRRDFMKAGAAVGAVSALAGCTGLFGGGGSQHEAPVKSTGHLVPPGKLDTYYGFWSGGHSGELRVMGVPSMRPLMRIPMFQPESARGWAHDKKSQEILKNGQSEDLRKHGGHFMGDSHHPVLSESGGDYDGEYVWINDKANGRIGRANLKYFETDAITDIPNMQACHGMAVQSPDTKYVYGVGEFRVPIPNDGTNVDDPSKYWSTFAALDPETMDVKWQLRVSGNLDNADTGKNGRWAFATGYNRERAFKLGGMTHDDRDYLKAFDIPRIEELIKQGKAEDVNGVPVLDARIDSDLEKGSRPPVRYIPTPKSPHGCDVTPSGKYVTASGKLSPTVTVADISKLGQTDAAVTKDPIVGRPKVGLGPLHTTWDGRGHGYTSCFIDSVVTKWDIEEAVNAKKNSKKPVKGKIPVHYNPGHVQAVEAETVDPAGDYLVSLNKLSKDRFLSTGPMQPDNDQLIDISKDKPSKPAGGMKLVSDEPVYPEPHDAVFAHRDKINPNQVWDKSDYEGEKPFVKPSDARVERTGDESVHVYTSAVRSHYALRDFKVKEGDEVTLTVTNIESVNDMIHGICIPRHGINLAITPQDTREVTFTADEPGVYWVYCTYFCSALHLEMRSRMIVEPRD
ncbi:MAG: TAT-dependent nitrous-oxide reductase [Halorientalis sp.]